MHQYLKAVGFGKIKSKRQMEAILDQVEKEFTYLEIIGDLEDDYCEYGKNYGDGIGIALCGELDDMDHFQKDFYFPYVKSDEISSYADIIVEQKKDNQSYMGICEDVRAGVSIIFFLQNGVEYMRASQNGQLEKKGTSLTLTGLGMKGTVLLPIVKDPVLVKSYKEEARNRMMLLSAARKGDADAIESLTLEDIDLYNKVSKRLVTEDVFSIVETYFMPYGVECDQYSVMGEIKSLEIIVNEMTKEKIYKMRLEVSEILMDVCIAVDDLEGEPQVGRRFKGTIWLQGYINFVK